MIKKLLFIFIHPVFILLVITGLECIPYASDLGKTVVHELPKVGDNFQVAGDLAVYYFNGKGKYSYGSAACYFSYGNPSWYTKYEDGGIKTIDAQTAQKIPFLGNMCDKTTHISLKKSIPSRVNYLSTNYLLENFSDLSHVLCYVLLSLSLLYHYRMHPKKNGIAFAVCFVAGGALEFVQKFFIVGRNASIEDQVRNTLGALIGLALYAVFQAIFHKKDSPI